MELWTAESAHLLGIVKLLRPGKSNRREVFAILPKPSLRMIVRRFSVNQNYHYIAVVWSCSCRPGVGMQCLAEHVCQKKRDNDSITFLT